MKIEIKYYEFTYTAELDDDCRCDQFCDVMQELINAVWGEDRLQIGYTDKYAEIRERVDRVQKDGDK